MFGDYNWWGFGVSFILLAIIPVWIIRLFEMGFFIKLGLTIVLGVIIFFAVQRGGFRRGLVFKK